MKTCIPDYRNCANVPKWFYVCFRIGGQVRLGIQAFVHFVLMKTEIIEKKKYEKRRDVPGSTPDMPYSTKWLPYALLCASKMSKAIDCPFFFKYIFTITKTLALVWRLISEKMHTKHFACTGQIIHRQWKIFIKKKWTMFGCDRVWCISISRDWHEQRTATAWANRRTGQFIAWAWASFSGQ